MGSKGRVDWGKGRGDERVCRQSDNGGVQAAMEGKYQGDKKVGRTGRKIHKRRMGMDHDASALNNPVGGGARGPGKRCKCDHGGARERVQARHGVGRAASAAGACMYHR